MAVTLTIDLEDPTERYDANGRYVAMTRRILDLCDAQQRKATFFVVGCVSKSAPRLIEDIAAKGHEIAYHSHAHVPLTEEDPARFRRESKTDKDRLEQLSGKPVIGFRAPRFSLTPQSIWAVDALGELGFRYSSSIMPTRVSLFGFPGTSRTPFKWPNGLIELPLPVTALGNVYVPYLGGIYLYALPFWVTRCGITKADPEEILWTYTHPYDFDRDEKFTLMPHTPAWVSAVLWLSRHVAEKKITKILSLGGAPVLAEQIKTIKLPYTYS